MRHYLCLVGVFLMASTTLLAESTQFTNANVIDVITGKIQSDQTITVKEGKIQSVTAGKPENKASEVIDLAGAYVIPGLWDAHLHSGGDIQQMQESLYPTLRKHGITQFRDMGLSMANTQAITTALADGKLSKSPLIYKAGPLIDGREKRWYAALQYIVKDEAEVAKALDDLQAAGVDFVKIYQDLSVPVYKELVSQAKARGLTVAGHVPTTFSIKLLGESGQTTIEHMDISALMSCNPEGQRYFGESLNAKFGQGYPAYYQVMINFLESIDWETCSANLKAFGDSGGAWTPTLIMELFDRNVVDNSAVELLNEQGNTWCETQLKGIDTASQELRDTYLKSMQGVFTKIREAGITILAGTDSPNYCNVPGQSLLWELKRLKDLGLSNLEVLQAATTNPSKVFGFPQKGQIADGFDADLLVLDNNPLENLEALRSIKGVYTNGEWLVQ